MVLLPVDNNIDFAAATSDKVFRAFPTEHSRWNRIVIWHFVEFSKYRFVAQSFQNPGHYVEDQFDAPILSTTDHDEIQIS